ncbi:hypothetical protein ON010_g3412 [Phytophthora cinnamomi]|nr:hypothetical protein ON010_g3412 [Phytophthora cinnamomi]
MKVDGTSSPLNKDKENENAKNEEHAARGAAPSVTRAMRDVPVTTEFASDRPSTSIPQHRNPKRPNPATVYVGVGSASLAPAGAWLHPACSHWRRPRQQVGRLPRRHGAQAVQRAVPADVRREEGQECQRVQLRAARAPERPGEPPALLRHACHLLSVRWVCRIYRPKVAAAAGFIRIAGFVMYVKGYSTGDPGKRRKGNFGAFSILVSSALPFMIFIANAASFLRCILAGHLGTLVMLGLSLEAALRLLGHL